MKRTNVMKVLLLLILPLFVSACEEQPAVSIEKPVVQQKGVPVYTYEIVNVFPHDPGAFTQGLVFNNGILLESTGQYGSSTLRKVELTSGKPFKRFDLPNQFFGEGLAILNDKIYQLTWQEKTAFVYDMNLSPIGRINYSGEGWGLTTDGQTLIMSDGTQVIRFVDPETFETKRTIVVRDDKNQPIRELNELEWVKGEIWANIWHSDRIGKPNHIARIDPNTGNVIGWIDLDGISPQDVAKSPENTLNGIAYDEKTDRIFVTGKQWEKLFEIRLRQK